MTELKTLKNFQAETGVNTFSSQLLDDLKAEAIKWVKMLQERIDKGIAYDFEKSKIEWKAQIDILRIFHNITEEDLK